MRKIFSTLVVGLTASFALNANAALVTEYYTSTVTNIENISGIGINDTFNWSVTFDNESRRMTMDSDGLDGIANTADDTFYRDYCISRFSDGCTNSFDDFSDRYNMFSDATFDLSALSGITGANFVSTLDARNTNSSHAQNRLDGRTFRSFVADDFSFWSSIYSNGFSEDNFTLLGLDQNGASAGARVLFTSTLNYTETADVPEPATLALFGLGLAGLGMSRRKAK